MAFDSQSYTTAGDIKLASVADLTGFEGYLVKMTSTGVAVPTALTDRLIGVVIDGNDGNQNATIRPLSPAQNIRVIAKGSIAQGDILTMADPATTADRGKVRTNPATASTTQYFVGIAEEAASDGNLVRVRPFFGSQAY